MNSSATHWKVLPFTMACLYTSTFLPVCGCFAMTYWPAGSASSSGSSAKSCRTMRRQRSTRRVSNFFSLAMLSRTASKSCVLNAFGKKKAVMIL